MTLRPMARYDAAHYEQRAMSMPDGGLWSTTADIARFANAFLLDSNNGGGGLLQAETIRTMLTEQCAGPIGPDGSDGMQRESGMGLGWHL